jgi:hypothetical protein
MTWLLMLGGLFAVAAWLALHQEWQSGRGRPSSPSGSGGSRVVHAVVVLAWLYSVAPPMIGLFERGRLPIAYGSQATVTPTEAHVSTALSFAIAGLCIWLVVTHIGTRRVASAWRLAALVAPWLAIELISALDSGYLPGRQFLLLPLIAVAFWLAAPSLRVIQTLGVTVIVTALVSLALAVATPLGLLNTSLAGIDKAFIGSGSRLLAGPYNAPNSLGLSLALGLSAVVTLPWMRIRLIGIAAVAFAVLWTASRTSILATAAVLLVYAASRRRSTALFRIVGASVALVGLIGVLFLPYYEKNPFAFTQRGAIWIASLQTWHRHFWLGAGSGYYERPNGLGLYALYGHNLFVDTAVRAGVIGLLGVAAMLSATVVTGVRLAAVTRFPLLLAVGIAFTSLLEVPLAFNNLGILGFATWVPIAVSLFTSDSEAFVLAPRSSDVRAEYGPATSQAA